MPPPKRGAAAASALALLLLFSQHASGQQAVPGITPAPATMEAGGRRHTFAGLPAIRVADDDDAELARLARHATVLLRESLERPQTFLPSVRRGTGVVELELDRAFPDTSREAYAIVTTRDGVRITARDYPGIFYALQTIRQLVTPSPPDGWSVPAVRIADRPRFAYRGMHLDVSRHFFSADVVKRYIDLLARYKLNTFHWHLTDDQGWRIEIQRYPRLTEVGGCRRETMVDRNFDPYVGDGVPHCGFYTREEIRDVVAYAAERYITIVPEIEMPGHATAALAAYPELACTPGPFEVATSWGVFDDIFCPTGPTFAFLEGVLAELIELFPGPWVHIGGDEVPRTRWRESEQAQEVMRRERLANEDELQSWFIARVERFLHGRGRRLIGWDEILEGGLPPRATVMSWRGMAGGIEAARLGHDVIMSPTEYAYFDYYQGDPAAEPPAIGGLTALERVYAFEPIPEVLSADEARHILGPQANLWTEYVKTPEHLEYMLLPRLLALAEVAWSPREARNWENFQARLPEALEDLDRLGVHYRIPDVRGLDGERLVLDTAVTLRLESPLPRAAVHYTLDGSEPDTSSPRYRAPLALSLTQPVHVKARLVLPNGRRGPVSAGLFRRTSLRMALAVDERALGAGLRYAYFETRLASVRELDARQPPTASSTVAGVTFQGTEREEHFALTFTGYIRVPADGVYRFTLLSDDGAVLWIGDDIVVDHDGLHGPTERAGEIALAAGHHPIRLTYFQAGGGKVLALFVTPPEGERMAVPPEWFRAPL